MSLLGFLFKDWGASSAPTPKPSPTPGPQGPLGPSHERAAFAEPEPGIIEQFVGFWRGHAVYRERGPKVTWVRDQRAIDNEKAKAKRQQESPLSFLDDSVDGHAMLAYSQTPDELCR